MGRFIGTFFRGLRFGMLLQFAVGPVCLFIFQTGIESGFSDAFLGVLGVVMGDGVFVILSLVGIGALLKRSERMQVYLRIGGSAILFVFGLSFVFSAFGISILPSWDIFAETGKSGAFFTALLLTLSNPLTILFWTGVFSAQISDTHMGKTELFGFAIGCLSATLAFLSIIALLGQFTNALLPEGILVALNVIVGAAMMVYAAMRLFPKKEAKEEDRAI